MDVHQEAMDILAAVKGSIEDAKKNKVSPEKLAPLYTNWIKSLELASEILGAIRKPGDVPITKILIMINERKDGIENQTPL